jgi:hypothetical protein
MKDKVKIEAKTEIKRCSTSVLALILNRRGDMVEGALTLPVMALVTLALVNLALAGYAASVANHAAGYGARAGSVAQADPAGAALGAAQQALASGVGTYTVQVAADTYPGGVVRVAVDWEVPNIYGSLMPLFGQSNGPLKGTAVSAFRKEGW